MQQAATRALRLQIRRYAYRGREGFLLSGRVPSYIFPISIFVRRRGTAEAIRDIYKAEPQWREQRNRRIDRLIAKDAREGTEE